MEKIEYHLYNFMNAPFQHLIGLGFLMVGLSFWGGVPFLLVMIFILFMILNVDPMSWAWQRNIMIVSSFGLALALGAMPIALVKGGGLWSFFLAGISGFMLYRHFLKSFFMFKVEDEVNERLKDLKGVIRDTRDMTAGLINDLAAEGKLEVVNHALEVIKYDGWTNKMTWFVATWVSEYIPLKEIFEYCDDENDIADAVKEVVSTWGSGLGAEKSEPRQVFVDMAIAQVNFEEIVTKLELRERYAELSTTIG